MSVFFVEFQTNFSADYSTTSWILSLLDFTMMLCGEKNYTYYITVKTVHPIRCLKCLAFIFTLREVNREVIMKLFPNFLFYVSAAPLGSYLGNRLTTRVAVMTGGLISSFGLVLSSFAPSLQFLYMSLGILTGETPKQVLLQ